jgi:predicted transcriptional regulator
MNPQVSVFISIHWAERRKEKSKGKGRGKIQRISSKTSVIV